MPDLSGLPGPGNIGRPYTPDEIARIARALFPALTELQVLQVVWLNQTYEAELAARHTN